MNLHLMKIIIIWNQRIGWFELNNRELGTGYYVKKRYVGNKQVYWRLCNYNAKYSWG